MKVVIVGGGNEPSKDILDEELKNADFLICADGGANCLYKYNIIPNYLIGDFDSINKDILDYYSLRKCCVDTYSKDKDYTDSQICFNKAIELKANEICMLGFTGNRLDHFIGNLGLLLKCNELGIKGTIIDNNNKIMIADKSIHISPKKNRFFSLQAYSDKIENLSILGAKFPLHNYTLLKGDTRTISNEFLDDEVYIKFDSGILLIIIAAD